MSSLGIVLLAAFLIFTGLLGLFHLQFEGEATVLGLLALGAGVALLLGLVNWPVRHEP